MKKVFFAFVTASVVVLASCGDKKPAADTTTQPVDTAAAKAAATPAATPVDTAAAAAKTDTAAKAATPAAPAAK